MRLHILYEDSSFTGDLVEDPNWIMYVSNLGSFKTPLNYQQVKEEFTHYFREHKRADGFEIESLQFIYDALKKASLFTNIDGDDYPQIFKPADKAGSFHDEDEFQDHPKTTHRKIYIRANEVVISYPHSADVSLLPQDAVNRLHEIANKERIVLMQAFDSYLRDNGRSIRMFGVRNLPFYGM